MMKSVSRMLFFHCKPLFPWVSQFLTSQKKLEGHQQPSPPYSVEPSPSKSQLASALWTRPTYSGTYRTQQRAIRASRKQTRSGSYYRISPASIFQRSPTVSTREFRTRMASCFFRPRTTVVGIILQHPTGIVVESRFRASPSLQLTRPIINHIADHVAESHTLDALNFLVGDHVALAHAVNADGAEAEPITGWDGRVTCAGFPGNEPKPAPARAAEPVSRNSRRVQ